MNDYSALIAAKTSTEIAMKQKAEAETRKADAESRKAMSEAIRNWGALLAFTYGVLGVFTYSFFDIHFFPSGLSAGDALLYGFVALGLSFLSLALSLFGTMFFIPAFQYEFSCRNALRTPPPSAIECDPTWAYFVCMAWAYMVGSILKICENNFGLGAYFLGAYLIVMAINSLVIVFVANTSDPRNLNTHKLLKSFYSMFYSAKLGWNRKPWDFLEKLGYGFIYIFLTPIFGFYFAKADDNRGFLLVPTIFAGFLLVLALTLIDPPLAGIPSDKSTADESRSSNEKRSFRTKLIAIFLIVTLTFPALILPNIRIYTFGQMGFRVDDAAVSLSPGNLSLVSAAAEAAGIALSICRGNEGTAIVSPIDVRWHGLGTRSLVALRRSEKGSPSIDLELAADGVKIVRHSNERCVEVGEAALFQSNSNKFIEDGDPKFPTLKLKAILDPQLKTMGNKWAIQKIEIIGHSDPMPLPKNGNSILASDRAEAVKELLSQIKFTSDNSEKPVEFNVRSSGARHPVKTCETKEPKAIQIECNEINRRVELILRLVPSNRSQ